MDADGRPSLLQQSSDVGITEWSELVDESYSREQLRVTGHAFFDPGHSDHTMPSPLWSKMERSCSKLFIAGRSASSTTIRVVGSGTARSLASVSLRVSPLRSRYVL